MNKSDKPKRGHLGLILKLLFVGILLFFLYKKDFISVQYTKNAFKNWPLVLYGIGAYVLTTCLGVLRWQWLLKAHGIKMQIARTFQLTLIGSFFNVALPGAVSGDVVKAFYVGKEVKGHRVRAFGSIIFDRVVGLSALALVSAVALMMGFSLLKGAVVLVALKLMIIISAMIVVAFYGYLFFVGDKNDPLLKVLQYLEQKLAKLEMVRKLYEVLRHYHHHKLAVLKVLGVSVLIQLLIGWACLNFAYALGETEVSALAIYIIVPLGLLITAIPVLPAGVGTGHAAFLYLFSLIGSNRGADVFTMVAMVNILFGTIGSVIYIRFRSREAKPDLSDIKEIAI
ncbi:MAG: lysylphosphatidylglycerol synthase transmembrane domain-containing protein [Bdellovibrionota bacterium]